MNRNKVIEYITSDLDLLQKSIINTIELFDDGSTIPFIARYRKERTGNLDEVQIKQIFFKYEYYTELENRKETILNTINEQGKMTDELRSQIISCKDKQTLEDIYLPYKPKKRTRATIAREKGLEPLANIMIGETQTTEKKEEILLKFIDPDKGISTIEEAISGAKDIIAEKVSENSEIRKKIRLLISNEGKIDVKPKKEWKDKKSKYENYYSFSALLNKEPSHRVLAIRRGVKEGILSEKILINNNEAISEIQSKFVSTIHKSFKAEVKEAISDSYKRLINPSIEKEVFNLKIDNAENEAIKVFAKNLENILLASPAGEKVIMGIDPGFRTGCKVAVIDKQGDFKEYKNIFPHEPQNKKTEAAKIIKELVSKYNVELIAIGNGTASKETDIIVKQLIKEENLSVIPIVVSEAGASVYSASEKAAKEFPDLDLTVRGAISIARRLQDPLSELVKIEPCSIGVGQYQHDVNQKELKKSLDMSVEFAVNKVGVDLNTASVDLLSYIAGIGTSLAKEIVAYRTKNGSFKNRHELLKVTKLGKKSFEQSAGFLRIFNEQNPLDNSAIHPESYSIVAEMAKDLNVNLKDFIGNQEIIDKIDIKKYVKGEVGIPTLTDIINELKKPGRDPRKEFEQFSFSMEINEIDDLKEGLVLDGIITNVTDFGAFTDIGVHQDGLIHISKLSNKFVKNPHEIVSVGDVVRVKVLTVDKELKRISLERITSETVN